MEYPVFTRLLEFICVGIFRIMTAINLSAVLFKIMVIFGNLRLIYYRYFTSFPSEGFLNTNGHR